MSQAKKLKKVAQKCSTIQHIIIIIIFQDSDIFSMVHQEQSKNCIQPTSYAYLSFLSEENFKKFMSSTLHPPCL